MEKAMKPFFPVFLDLENQRTLVIGTNEAAIEKIEKLLFSGAIITIIATKISSKVLLLKNDYPNQINIYKNQVTKGDVRNNRIIFSAINNAQKNDQIRSWCKEFGILFNAIDRPNYCDFYMSSQIERGPLQIAISTQGKFPGLATAIRSWLETILPDQDINILEEMTQVRHQIKQKIPDPNLRRKILMDLTQNIKNQYLKIDTREKEA